MSALYDQALILQNACFRHCYLYCNDWKHPWRLPLFSSVQNFLLVVSDCTGSGWLRQDSLLGETEVVELRSRSCPACGRTDKAIDALFCPHCGTQLKSSPCSTRSKTQFTLLDGCVFIAFLGCILSTFYPFLGQKMTEGGVAFYCIVRLSRLAFFDSGLSLRASFFLHTIQDVCALLLAVGYALSWSSQMMHSLVWATLGGAGYFISRAMIYAASQRRAKASKCQKDTQ